MDNFTSTQDVKTEKTQYIKIDNCTYKLVSYYHGDKTYMDTVKDVLKMEVERTYFPSK